MNTPAIVNILCSQIVVSGEQKDFTRILQRNGDFMSEKQEPEDSRHWSKM